MLTRIEIDGFKTFEGFSMEVSPFVVILGPNASGKSNLFDAIRLLSRIAGADLRTALRELRGEPHELFRRDTHGEPGTRMTFAVEVLLDPQVRDPWGALVEITHSRVRYEVVIERRKDPREIERLVVAREEAQPIQRSQDQWQPEGRPPGAAFRQAFLKYRRKTPWLTTSVSGGLPTFNINQDGRQGGSRPAEAAEATVLSSITNAEFSHLYALREELRSWRFLQLDPAALRRPSPTTAGEMLEPDGSNLATVLARIQAETATDLRPRGVLADIAADLAALIPGIIDVNVVEDAAGREYRVDVTTREGPPFSSRVLSDGTLRALALLTLLHDPKHRGLVCFEEPENGVHPLRLRAMIQRLCELVSDPQSDDLEQAPLSQMLLSSHSPVVLAAVDEGQVMFTDVVGVVDPAAGIVSHRTRMRPGRRATPITLNGDSGAMGVTSFEIRRFLASADRET